MRPKFTTAKAAAGVVASALLFTTALLGSTSATTASAASESKAPTFTMGITDAVDSFNPFNGIVASSFEAWSLMYDYMISWAPKDMSPQPGLATSWDTSKDGLTWTFHIRSGVQWSDGVPLTARDIAYTYNRILHGSVESGTWGSYLKSVKSVTAPDATTVVLQLSKPNAVLPLLPMPIIPQHVWKHVSEGQVKTYPNEPVNGKPVVGSGPFELVEGKSDGSTYRFIRNPNYWGGEPHVGDVTMQVFQSEDTLIQALKAGDIDFAEGINALQVTALQGQPGITAQNGNSPGFDEIAFNTGSVNLKTGKPMGNPNPAVLDPKFRFALNFAIDRKTIVSRVYQGAGQPAYNIIPPAYPTYYWKSPTSNAYAYDPAKAKRLLNAAGYTMGSDGFRTLPNGQPIGQLQLYARSDSPTSQNTIALLKEWLSNVGIDSTVISVQSNKLTNIILQGNYDIFQWGWYVEPDPDSILSYFTCGQRGVWSDSWYCNPKYDRLYTQQHAEMNLAKRAAIVQRMQTMLYNDAPYLNTVYSQIGEAYRSDRWTGFVPQPSRGGVLLYQYGHANYLNMRPVSQDSSNPNAATSSSDSSSSSGQTMIIVLAALAAVVALAAGAFAYRRAHADQRE